jgi:hypothetical protein
VEWVGLEGQLGGPVQGGVPTDPVDGWASVPKAGRRWGSPAHRTRWVGMRSKGSVGRQEERREGWL